MEVSLMAAVIDCKHFGECLANQACVR